MGARLARGNCVLRFIGSFFGAIFTLVTLGLMAAAVSVGAVLWFYSRDLPSHESLANYTPPTISRIYDGEGRNLPRNAACSCRSRMCPIW